MDTKSDIKKTKTDQAQVMHAFNTADTTPLFSMKTISILIIAIVLGIGTGYFVSPRSSVGGKLSESVEKAANASSIKKGDSFGSDDKKTYKDSAEGKLNKGGIEGEGQFHLVRPGGETQNVYLTSAIVDLSQFEGRKIKVWGQTQKAQYAGWLMDVGRVEVLE